MWDLSWFVLSPPNTGPAEVLQLLGLNQCHRLICSANGVATLGPTASDASVALRLSQCDHRRYGTTVWHTSGLQLLSAVQHSLEEPTSTLYTVAAATTAECARFCQGCHISYPASLRCSSDPLPHRQCADSPATQSSKHPVVHWQVLKAASCLISTPCRRGLSLLTPVCKYCLSYLRSLHAVQAGPAGTYGVVLRQQGVLMFCRATCAA